MKENEVINAIFDFVLMVTVHFICQKIDYHCNIYISVHAINFHNGHVFQSQCHHIHQKKNSQFQQFQPQRPMVLISMRIDLTTLLSYELLLFYLHFQSTLTSKRCVFQLRNAFGEEAPSKATIYNLCSEFKSDRAFLSDEFREKRPRIAVIICFKPNGVELIKIVKKEPASRF